MKKGDKVMKVWCLNTIFVILNGFCREFERVLEGKKGQIKSTLIETIVILSLISIVSVSASAQVTTVSIGETSVSSCNFITIPIMIIVSSLDAPDGLDAATINLTYDPSVCVVTEAKNSSFDSFTSSHLCTNTSGYVRMIAYQTGPTGIGPGLVKFADVRLYAVGGDENISRLNLIVDVLKNNAGTAVPYTIVSGAFKTVPMTPVMSGKQGKLSAELVKPMKESSPDDELRVIVQSDFIINPTKLDLIKGIGTEILVIKDRMIIIDATKEQIGKIAEYGWVSLIDLDVLGEAHSSNSRVSDVINRNQEIFKSPISDKEYEIIKLFPEETVMYKDQNGTIYNSKQEIFDNEISELSIDPNLLKLDRKLRDIIQDGKVNDTVPIIVAFFEQPAHDISVDVKAEYEPRFEEITEQAREIYERIKPMLGTEEEFFSKEISEVINTEQDLLTDKGKRVLNETRILLDQEVMQMRREIFTQSAPLVDEIQAPIIGKMVINDCEMKYSGKIYNSVTANVPVSYLEELSKETSIAMIWYDYVFNATLDISIAAIDADYWWGQGYTGGAWDAAVVDTGIDGSHPALSVYAADVFHSSAVSDPAYNDNQFSTDDLQGHGTHCAGIIASDDSTYRGVAYGMDALINAKAGWRNTIGRGSMYWSDAMEAIDWAILHCAADADAISFSFGGSPGANGDTGFCHYMDAVVFDLNTPVAISAGNDGPSSTTVREPGSAYNVITVGNIDDKNTKSRSDDSIAYSSSRGPTGDGRIKPDICAPGTSIMSCNNRWEESGQSNIVSKSGTSMAAPHIAGSILLILDYVATQWDAKAVKALLLTTAEDKGTAGPDNDYGYGYEDLQHAYFHRDDVHRGSLEDKPEGEVEKYYKGYAYSGDTATLVWNRHVIYNDAYFPTQYLDLSDFDLLMYDELNNNLIDYSTSTISNVEQVESDATYSSSIIKIEPYGIYPTGITSESYALGTEEGFAEVDPPTLSADLSIPGTVSSDSSFTASVTVTNNGDIKAHSVEATLDLPSGFSIIGGANPQTLGIIDGGSSKAAMWTVRAPTVSSTQSYTLSTDADSYSYDELYTAYDSETIEVVRECEGTDTSCGIYPNCENCNAKDGCYSYGSGCEERDYYCASNLEGCKYTYSNRHTDYYDDFVNYCKGDEVWKHRQFHDFYCEGGTCTDHTSWADDQLVENCNDYDGWVDTGNTDWADVNECQEKELKEQKYRDYSCSGGACTYSETGTQWVDTGTTQNKPDGTICGCTARNTLKRCYGGVCTDTGICDATTCGADVACDGKEPGDSCGGGVCDSNCKCPVEGEDIAAIRDRLWYVDTTGDHIADQWFYYGLPDDTFIVADINRDGTDDIVAVRGRLWYVDSNGDHIADQWFYYGLPDDTFIVADINRDGTDDIVAVRGRLWYVDTNGDHIADLWFYYGLPGDTFIVADINRDGIDDIAAIRDRLWYVDTNGDHIADLWFYYGLPGDTFIVADINRDGIDDIAAIRDRLWYVDTNGDHIADLWFYYGLPGDTFIVADIG